MARPLGGVTGSQQAGWAAALRDLTDTIIVSTFNTMSTKYTWHERKRQSNLEKHRLDFKDSDVVIDSPYRLDITSSRNGEQRQQSGSG